jgi:hypothetical protein
VSEMRTALGNTLRYITDRPWLVLGYGVFVAVTVAVLPVSAAWPQ